MRTAGSVGFKTLEFAQKYDELTLRYKDPVEVLFKLMNSRKQAVMVQAASVLLSYRYPKQAVAKLEIERAGQIVMEWEQTIEHAPAEPMALPDIIEQPGMGND